MFSLGCTEAGIYPFPKARRQMSNERLPQAPEAASTGYETNSRARQFEVVSDEFAFEVSDSMPCGGSYFGCDEFIGFWTRSPRNGPNFATRHIRARASSLLQVRPQRSHIAARRVGLAGAFPVQL
jgi:hypothetical protein